MNQELINSITEYVEKNIGDFHAARIEKLKSIKLRKLLARKNPYMFKAKNIVKAGDTLAKIAKKYGTTVDSLCEKNNITRRTILRIGRRLIL